MEEGFVAGAEVWTAPELDVAEGVASTTADCEGAGVDGEGVVSPDDSHAPPRVFKPWSSGLIRIERLTPVGCSQLLPPYSILKTALFASVRGLYLSHSLYSWHCSFTANWMTSITSGMRSKAFLRPMASPLEAASEARNLT